MKKNKKKTELETETKNEKEIYAVTATSGRLTSLTTYVVAVFSTVKAAREHRMKCRTQLAAVDWKAASVYRSARKFAAAAYTELSDAYGMTADPNAIGYWDRVISYEVVAVPLNPGT